MEKIFCFGELLLRLSPAGDGKWIEQNQMPVYMGGAELNVATALACWDLNPKYVSALPDNYLSHEIMRALENKNIDTSAMHVGGERIGTYYMPQGADLKNASVIYDRAYSSFSTLKPGMLDWHELLKDCSWFHFSAISPALSKDLADVCAEGVKLASEKGLTISVDLNFRAKLWKYGKDPTDIMPALVKYCDVIMGNAWAANTLLGIPVTGGDSMVMSKDDLASIGKESISMIRKHFTSAHTIAYTFRMKDFYFAMISAKNETSVSQTFELKNLVDKAGSGDCFMGGLIYGLANGHANKDIIDFAAAAAVCKMQEKGDATKNSIADIEKIISR